MEGEKIQLRGLNVFFQTAGSGPAVLVLHGWGGSSASWEKTMESLASRGFHAVCLDLPGFGKTETPKEAWSLDDYAGFVREFSEKLSLKDYFLVGHSFGGRISIKLSLIDKERIKKIVLCGSAGLKMKKGLKGELMAKAVSLAKKVPFLRNFFKKPLYFLLRNKDYVKAGETMKKVMALAISEDLEPLLPLISHKTLLIWGEKDKLVPLKYARIFKEKIRNSELQVVKGAGHSLNLEKPSLLAEKISLFLKNG